MNLQENIRRILREESKKKQKVFYGFSGVKNHWADDNDRILDDSYFDDKYYEEYYFDNFYDMDMMFGHKHSLFGTRGLEPGDPNRSSKSFDMYNKQYGPMIVRVIKNNDLQESITRILREESKIPPLMLRRRMNEIPKYIRAAYEWLNAKTFDSFNEFIERVIFSTTRDFVSDYGTNDYDKNLKIRDELTPYISEIIYDEYLDEIKDYYHK